MAQLIIIEVLVAVDYRILAIMLLHEFGKHSHAVLQLLAIPSTLYAMLLHVKYWYQVLLTLLHDTLEVHELGCGRRSGSEEMVRAYLQASLSRFRNVSS